MLEQEREMAGERENKSNIQAFQNVFQSIHTILAYMDNAHISTSTIYGHKHTIHRHNHEFYFTV